MHKAALVDGGRCAQQPAGDLRAHAALFSRLAYGSKQASAAQRHRNSGRLEPKWLRKMTMMTIMTVVTVVMMMVMLVMTAMMVMMALLSATGARGAHCPHLQRLQSSCTGAKERHRNKTPPSVIRKPGPQSVVRVIRNPCHLPIYMYYYCVCYLLFASAATPSSRLALCSGCPKQG